MITFDEAAWKAVAKDLPTKLRRCRNEILVLLGHHYPTLLDPNELHHIFLRYFRFKKRSALLEGYRNFMGMLIDEKDVEAVYHHRVLQGYRICRNAATKGYIGLQPCLQVVRRCREHQCAHTEACEAYQRQLTEGTS